MNSSRPSTSDKSSIAFIALSLETYGEYSYSSFLGLPANEKITMIARRIQEICEEMKIKEPNSMWVIAWREYGISNEYDKKKLSPDIKQILKKAMLCLTNKYPNLVIIAGSLSTKSSIPNEKSQEKLKRIIQYYKNHEWVAGEEEPEYFSFEYEKVKKALEELKIDLEVVRNTCYIFNGNTIWCHDKLTPISEMKNSKLDTQNINCLYQPGSKKNITNSSICILNHPISGLPVKFGVEICREHQFGVLQKACSLQLPTLKVSDNRFSMLQGISKEMPFIHVILSDNVRLLSRYMHGSCVIQLDRTNAPRLMIRDISKSPFTLSLYQNYITEEIDSFQGPLELDHVFVYQVLDKFKQAAEAISNKKVLLEIMAERFFCEVNKHDAFCNDIKTVYEELKRILDSLYLPKPTTSDLFSPPPLNAVVDDLRVLLAVQEKNYALSMEYKTVSTAKPLSMNTTNKSA